MKTIEERAELNLMYEKDFCGYSLCDDMVCRAYVRGAKEQKAIDIDKACEWLEAYIACGVSPEGTYGFVARFRKAMEE